MKVKEIRLFEEKGHVGKKVDTASLVPGVGIEGDRFKDVSMITTTAKNFMEEYPGGLCFQRLKTNLLVDGDLVNGETTLGDALVVITRGKKFCFVECPHFTRFDPCPMKEGVAFADVLKEGSLTILGSC